VEASLSKYPAMRKAIVIGCHVNGLGVIRSLKSKDFQIAAMFYAQIDFAHTSKFVQEKIRVPHPRKEEKEFVDQLIQSSERWKGALLIDTNDDVTVALSKNKNKLEKFFQVATPEWEAVRPIIEKCHTYRLADECGVPYPKTFEPETIEDLIRRREEISYPCILKPVVGHVFTSEFKLKNFKVHNFEELRSRFEFCLRTGHRMMVQEIIPGPDSNIYQCAMYIDAQRKTTAAFFYRKLRQNPPEFGVARVAISEEPIPILQEFTERMLTRIGFKGIMHSEFKKDSRDGIFKLMEINARIPRANWLATYCGINLPWIAYKDLVEHEQLQMDPYEKNVYWIEVSKDISHSLFRHKDDHLGLTEYLKPYMSKNKTFADISGGDFYPFIKRIANLIA
jgi:predicted ATP-grasp superfamily ATP-dependent carboligase